VAALRVRETTASRDITALRLATDTLSQIKARNKPDPIIFQHLPSDLEGAVEVFAEARPPSSGPRLSSVRTDAQLTILHQAGIPDLVPKAVFAMRAIYGLPKSRLRN
jgi:hypothetical protein